jgi:hypothetical protein
MAGYAWTDEEKAIVIYFASLSVDHKIIVKFLAQKGFSRTITGVRNKLTIGTTWIFRIGLGTPVIIPS